jgi:hypothetical protein
MGFLHIGGPGEVMGPVPLVIGVTGHCDLIPSQHDGLKRRVAAVIAEVRSECRYTPVLLLTALAEGADRLAAHVALSQQVRVVAALPMAREEYEKDFATSESREEFDGLLKRSSAVQVPQTDDDRSDPDEWRRRRYADAGAYIVANCDLLIALWDGRDTHCLGGTADVVRWQREGLSSTYTSLRGPLDPAGIGPVRHIPTARARSGPPVDTAEKLLGPGGNEEVVPDGLPFRDPNVRGEIVRGRYLGDAEWPIREQIHGFNRDAVELHSRLTAEEAGARKRFLDAYTGDIAPTVRPILETLVRCDALAGYFGVVRMKAIRWIFGWAATAIVLFTVFAHPGHGLLVLLLGYLTSFFLALRRAHKVRALRLEEKYLDYRALTEGLRVQLYWALAGIGDPVTEHYLRSQRTELAWIPRAIRALGVTWGFVAHPPVNSPVQTYRAVKKAWAVSQIKFFKQRIRAMERKERICKQASNVFFGLAIAGAAALLIGLMAWHGGLGALLDKLHFSEPVHSAFEWEITALALSAVTAGFFRAFAEKMGYAAQISRYKWMKGLHEQVVAAFREKAQDHPDRMPDLLMDLGRYALIENAEWLRIHRDRPLDVPVGG